MMWLLGGRSFVEVVLMMRSGLTTGVDRSLIRRLMSMIWLPGGYVDDVAAWRLLQESVGGDAVPFVACGAGLVVE